MPPFRRLIAVLGLWLAAVPAQASPVAYVLDPASSSVGFEVMSDMTSIRGAMPVRRAELSLDFDRVANSTIAVELAVDKARTTLPFAMGAMRDSSVLDVARHPSILFRSSRITAQGDAARVDGDLTIRGVTRPVTLKAMIFRQQGIPAGDRSRLTVQLTGEILRSDFGASGFAHLAGDLVKIDIRARIQAP